MRSRSAAAEIIDLTREQMGDVAEGELRACTRARMWRNTRLRRCWPGSGKPASSNSAQQAGRFAGPMTRHPIPPRSVSGRFGRFRSGRRRPAARRRDMQGTGPEAERAYPQIRLRSGHRGGHRAAVRQHRRPLRAQRRSGHFLGRGTQRHHHDLAEVFLSVFAIDQDRSHIKVQILDLPPRLQEILEDLAIVLFVGFLVWSTWALLTAHVLEIRPRSGWPIQVGLLRHPGRR